MIYLLDACVLIALTSGGHAHKQRCETWFSGVREFATCPTVEGSLVRYLLFTKESSATAQFILGHFNMRDGHQFWADSESYSTIDLSQVRGHKQTTDAYLVSMVRHHPNSQLATLDEALAALYPDDVYLISQ